MRWRTPAGLALIVVAALLGGGAAAQEPFHCPKPGTVIATSDGRVLTFGEAEGFVCHFRNGKGKPGQAYAIFARSEDSAVGKGMEKLWPLVVGKTYSLSAVNVEKSVDRAITLTVARRERIMVPAGTFDAYVVEWSENTSGGGHVGSSHLATFWYAPSVGYYVKTAFQMLRGARVPHFPVWDATRIVIP